MHPFLGVAFPNQLTKGQVLNRGPCRSKASGTSSYVLCWRLGLVVWTLRGSSFGLKRSCGSNHQLRVTSKIKLDTCAPKKAPPIKTHNPKDPPSSYVIVFARLQQPQQRRATEEASLKATCVFFPTYPYVCEYKSHSGPTGLSKLKLRHARQTKNLVTW